MIMNEIDYNIESIDKREYEKSNIQKIFQTKKIGTGQELQVTDIVKHVKTKIVSKKNNTPDKKQMEKAIHSPKSLSVNQIGLKFQDS